MTRPNELKLPSEPLRVQLQHKADWNEYRSAQAADFYTIGYSGRSIEEFIGALIALPVPVSTVIDVRQNPVSMYKPDFSKANLEAHLYRAGIKYLHEGK